MNAKTGIVAVMAAEFEKCAASPGDILALIPLAMAVAGGGYAIRQLARKGKSGQDTLSRFASKYRAALARQNAEEVKNFPVVKTIANEWDAKRGSRLGREVAEQFPKMLEGKMRPIMQQFAKLRRLK